MNERDDAAFTDVTSADVPEEVKPVAATYQIRVTLRGDTEETPVPTNDQMRALVEDGVGTLPFASKVRVEKV